MYMSVFVKCSSYRAYARREAGTNSIYPFKEMPILYRESNSMIEEQQGPTLGARFGEVSVL